MKYLQTLCEQADVQLSLKYYSPYLNALEEALLREAVKKKSARCTLQLLKALSLQILFLLQHSPFLWGEPYWRLQLAQSQSTLAAPGDDPHLRSALQQADEVITAAGVTRRVRKTIWDEVKHQSILPESQIKQYESARQACLERQTALDRCDEAITTHVQDYQQLVDHLPLPARIIPPSATDHREGHPTLRTYSNEAAKTRLSTENIHHQIQCEGEARVVYRNLAQELLQKPPVEKLAEEIKKSQQSLQRRVQHMTDQVQDYRQTIIRHAQDTIEHRTQSILAHAHRLEQISLSLAAIIYTVESHCPPHCQPLLNLLSEAQFLQKNLHQQENSRVLQAKLSAMNGHRLTYEKSITSFRVILFTRRRQLQPQQQLSQDLQTQLAQLVIPICSFNDKNTVASPETVKKLKTISDQLGVQQGQLAQEQDRINQIKNIFSA